MSEGEMKKTSNQPYAADAQRLETGGAPSTLSASAGGSHDHSGCPDAAKTDDKARRHYPSSIAAPSAGKAADDIPRGNGECILVLEDDPAVGALVEAMAKSLGYGVTLAATAADAIELLKCRSVDLVLSDIVLSGGTNGLEFAAQVRAAHPGIKVIFMSGYPADTAINEGQLADTDVLLPKPFGRRDFAEAINRAIG
ncbi:MAG: response regulator [Alphaproteobacteria bacterium]|nr:response regulator [Alphaproteobacteria bacterium]